MRTRFQVVLIRLRRVPIVLAQTFSLWLVLKTVMGVCKVMNYSQVVSLRNLFARTFDGKHPCEICTRVREGTSHTCDALKLMSQDRAGDHGEQTYHSRAVSENVLRGVMRLYASDIEVGVEYHFVVARFDGLQFALFKLGRAVACSCATSNQQLN